MNWYVQADLHHARSVDVFAIASSSTDFGSQSIFDYLSSIGSSDNMLDHERPGAWFQQNYIYNRQISLAIRSILQSYTLPECLFEHPTSIEIHFFETESSSHFVEDEVHILERIRNLIENGRVSDARHFLSVMPYEIFDKVENWRRVLARPRAKCQKSATGADLRKDSLWLRNNSDKFKGKWVALKQGSLLGSHESRIELHQLLKQAGKLHGAMFFKVEKE
jgi:hypothetical protein